MSEGQAVAGGGDGEGDADRWDELDDTEGRVSVMSGLESWTWVMKAQV